MADIVSVLGLNGVPELFMLSNDYLYQYKGKKAVVAIMAVDREHPGFVKAQHDFARLDGDEHIVIVSEDHADGPMHETFHCGPQEFCFALVDKEGKVVLRGDQIPSVQDALRLLKLNKPILN